MDVAVSTTERILGWRQLSLSAGSLFCLRVNDNQAPFEFDLDSVARSDVRMHPGVLQLSRRRPAAP